MSNPPMTNPVSSRLAAIEEQLRGIRENSHCSGSFSLTHAEIDAKADELAACLPEVRNLEEGQERCATCGHPMATHDSGPSEDGCRFKFGWGHECTCGWPVSDKKGSRRVDGSPDVPAAGSLAPTRDNEAALLDVETRIFYATGGVESLARSARLLIQQLEAAEARVNAFQQQHAKLVEAAKDASREWRLHGQLTDSARHLESAAGIDRNGMPLPAPPREAK